MSKFGGNGWESALNDEMLGQMLDQLLDIHREEPYNLQGQPLPRRNFFDYPPTQLNGKVTHVKSGLTQLPNNPPNSKHQDGGSPGAPRRQCKPRKTWSVEEHELFLVGLGMYGVNWKRISEEIVSTKTPSQLTSHAKKYFKCQKMLPSQRKRRSIHDITPQDLNWVIPANSSTVLRSCSRFLHARYSTATTNDTFKFTNESIYTLQ